VGTLWRRALPLVTVVVAGLLVTGCVSLLGRAPGAGQLVLTLTDAPNGRIDHLYVTIAEVQVNRVGSAAGQVVVAEPRTYDLLELQHGVEAVLGDVRLPEGRYTQIRLIVSNARVVIDGQERALTVPSGAQTGIKLQTQFEIRRDTVTSILLDFDAYRSLVETGNGSYILQPVIRAVPKVISGSLAGTVVPADSGARIRVLDVGGAEVAGSLIDPADGSFRIVGIVQGTYTVTVEAEGYETVTLADVAVTAGRETQLGTIELRAAGQAAP